MRMWIGLVALVVLMMASPAISEEESTEEGRRLEGLYVGGGVGGVVQGNAVGEVFVGHWWEFLGVEAGLSVFDREVDFEPDGGEETEVVDSTVVRVGVSGKAGPQIGFAKPYLGIGLRFEYADAESGPIDNGKQKHLWIAPRIGVDLLAAEHIVIGINLLSAAFTLYSDQSDTSSPFTFGGPSDGEIDEKEIEFLTGFSVSYLF